MAVLAVLIPIVMLGVVLALGRYEEWLLPDEDWLLPGPPVHQPMEAEGTALSH
ncbi:hypothetical protein O1Q96_32860 [Streptomyces sp. Qhu-G9]|uniref:hypothetical protein n=1 Tax=Streptomyces sp. Qhu-G9 TaxID=3452799 RepID=UPI0022AC0E2A|nr:hypothetical protein [Streptomyces aurantiacus]WAU84059.1 hypothetical protein O1Q96_32860 [Streptomyces aurantiacus]